MGEATGGEQVEFWNRLAKRYDFAARFCRVYPALVERVAADVGALSPVLDVAAGTGLVSMALAKQSAEVHAVDLSPAMVRALQRKRSELRLDRVRPVVANVYQLPYPDSIHAAAVCCNLLHIIADPQQALREIRRVTRSGSPVIIATFCLGENWMGRLKSHWVRLFGCRIYHRFTLASLRRLVEAAGFQVESAELMGGSAPLGYIRARRAR